VDLSFPREYGKSVNSVTQINKYLDIDYSLTLPTVDHICEVINTIQGEARLFKIDLARAFRQLKVDPADIYNLGIRVGNDIYLDSAVPFGWRTGTGACQRVTDCIRYLLNRQGIQIINYIDDFIGVSPVSDAINHFNITKNLLADLNFQISEEKTVAPSAKVTCLGIDIDCDKGILQIPEGKLNDIIDICRSYSVKKRISKVQLQSLIGSIIFLHKAVKPARAFINRIIGLLKQMHSRAHSIAIDNEMKKDLRWFIECAARCNGTVNINKDFTPHIDLFLDASFMGLGARWDANVYQVSLDNNERVNIAFLEALNIIVALRTWGNCFRGKNVRVWCDNQAAVAVLGNGRAHDESMQGVARNLWLWASAFDTNLQFRHIAGNENVVADMLSRWDAHVNPHATLFSLLNDNPIWAYPAAEFLQLNWEI
jgi:hypothetical protein